MRNRIFKYLYEIGALKFFKINKSNSIVLCFHRVHPDFDPITQPLSPNDFEQMLIGLNKHFNFFSLEQLFEKGFTDKNACYITFDDALIDFYEYAFPILKKLKIPATLFVPTESIDKGTNLYNYELAELINFANQQNVMIHLEGLEPKNKMDINYYLQLVSIVSKSAQPAELMSSIKKQLNVPDASDEIQPMTWGQISQLSSEGISIGSHFHSHIWLNSRNKSEIKDELKKSLFLINEHLNIQVKMVAYPMGAANQDVQQVVNEAGLLGFSTEGITFYPIKQNNKAYIPRFNVTDRSYQELLFRIGDFHRKLSL